MANESGAVAAARGVPKHRFFAAHGILSDKVASLLHCAALYDAFDGLFLCHKAPLTYWPKPRRNRRILLCLVLDGEPHIAHREGMLGSLPKGAKPHHIKNTIGALGSYGLQWAKIVPG